MKRSSFVLIIFILTVINILCVFKIYSAKKMLDIFKTQYDSCKIENEIVIHHLLKTAIINATQNSNINNKVQNLACNSGRLNAILLYQTGNCGSCLNFICEHLSLAGVMEKDIYIVLEEENAYLRNQLNQINVFNISKDESFFNLISSDKILVILTKHKEIICFQYDISINKEIATIIGEIKKYFLE